MRLLSFATEKNPSVKRVVVKVAIVSQHKASVLSLFPSPVAPLLAGHVTWLIYMHNQWVGIWASRLRLMFRAVSRLQLPGLDLARILSLQYLRMCEGRCPTAWRCLWSLGGCPGLPGEAGG